MRLPAAPRAPRVTVHVEWRPTASPWRPYAKLTFITDALLVALLTGAAGDELDDLVGPIDMPDDLTADTRATMLPGRATPPRPVLTSWLDARELDRVLSAYRRRGGRSAPVAWRALLALLATLEQESEARLVIAVDPGESGRSPLGTRGESDLDRRLVPGRWPRRPEER